MRCEIRTTGTGGKIPPLERDASKQPTLFRVKQVRRNVRQLRFESDFSFQQVGGGSSLNGRATLATADRKT